MSGVGSVFADVIEEPGPDEDRESPCENGCEQEVPGYIRHDSDQRDGPGGRVDCASQFHGEDGGRDSARHDPRGRAEVPDHEDRNECGDQISAQYVAGLSQRALRDSENQYRRRSHWCRD